MLPDAQSEGTLVVAMSIQAFFKEFLSKNTGLWKAAHSFSNFDVDESVGCDLVDEVVQ